MISLSHIRSGHMTVLWAIVTTAMVVSCAVMSDKIDQEALPQIPFEELVQATATYKDKTVILGGYVVSVENQKEQTQIVAVQAPLGSGQRPKSKDHSKGRLILIYDGFIDPEVYTKDRQLTVGGTLTASSATEQHTHPFPYLRVKVEEIHLWPELEPDSSDPFWDHDCYPYGWWRWHRYHHPWCW